MIKEFEFCEIKNTIQRLEAIEKVHEWFPGELEESEFLIKAIRKTRNYLSKNLETILDTVRKGESVEQAKPEPSS